MTEEKKIIEEDIREHIGENASFPFIEEIISDIKKKKELRSLDEEFIKRKLLDFFNDISNYQYKEKILKKLSKSENYKKFSKSKEHDFLIKNLRSELRKVYGAFILKDYEFKNKILKKLKSPDDFEGHVALLKLHKSTNERLNHYKELYDSILTNVSGKIKILDLACGLNPISSIFIRDRIKKYYASDISTEDCEFISQYFNKVKLDGEVFALDLIEKESIKKISSIPVDVCFIFKTLDGLERVERGITEKILDSINAKIIAVTFPTLSLSGIRPIKEHRRIWLEKLLNKMKLKWEKKPIENELLYLIYKR
ncbi:MAG: hypothetical protein KatS3mg002_0575 [Candidatus Woesearchaeota archaeon]|nr:MAG: hypothetical protein KatS3mg002_0575 [Candidatus Woesearchaeota archaeon]